MKKKVGQSTFIVKLGTAGDCTFHIDKSRKEETPIYKQIADVLIDLLQRGRLVDGSRLPTVRELSKALDVTRVTVHHAYNHLKKTGWAEARVGRGTFVRMMPTASVDSEELSTGSITYDKAMADLSILKNRGGMVSLAMAEPDSRLLPGREFFRTFRTMEPHAQEYLSYGPYQGAPLLRQILATSLRNQKMDVQADDILITTGVTQGLSLTISALCEKGDKVLVEQPTYLGFLSLLKAHGLEPIGIPRDEQGLRLDVLERLLKKEQPRALYTIPRFQNPTGTCMSQEHRMALLQLAKIYQLTIIEDDVYGELSYETDASYPLKAQTEHEDIVYVNSFSKSLFPGLRIGYIVPPATLKARLMELIRCRELCGAPFVQHALTHFLQQGRLQKHLDLVKPIYKRRRDALLSALAEYMPEEVHWSQPKGGFCCWLTLPRQNHFGSLYREALQHNIAFTPGAVFFMNADSTRHLRLCFGAQDEESICTAVQSLGGLIKDAMIRPGFHSASHATSSPIV